MNAPTDTQRTPDGAETGRTRKLATVLAAFAVLWAGSYVVFARTPAAPELETVQALTRSEPFLSGTRGEGVAQCLALPYQAPEVIVIGSSHVNAGIDAAEFAKASRLRTGLCALPRFNTDTLGQFVDYLDRHAMRPERIVWMADIGALLRGRLDAQRLQDSETLFTDARLQAETARGWLARAQDGEPPLAMSSGVFRSRLAAQETALAGLDAAQVRRRLEESRAVVFSRIFAIERRFEPHPNWQRNVAAFCEALDARGIALDVVISPLPDETAALAEFDPQEQLDALRSAMPCVGRGVARDQAAWGLDTLHFVARRLDFDYDYAVWGRDPAEFEAYVASLPPEIANTVFDVDHLNAVGARVFTRELVEALELGR